MSATLYDLGEALTAALAEIEAELERNGGEYTPEMAESLQRVEIDWSLKIERVALYYKGLLADAFVIQGEENRLNARRLTLEKRAEWLKAYLGRELTARGTTRVARPLVTVRIQDNPWAASATVPLEFLDPDWVRHTEPKLSLDKEAVLAAHKLGKPLPEGISVTRGQSVRVV